MKNGNPFVTKRFFSLLNRNIFLIPSNQTFSPTQHYFSPTIVLSNTLQHYINSDTPSYGLCIHSHIIKTGFVPNKNLSIKLLILYLKCNSLRFARHMFDGLPEKTLSAYNYMISGYLKHGQVDESISLVRWLLISGLKPDGYTFSMILKASSFPWNASLALGDLGRVVHAQVFRCDMELDDVLCTALVDSYVRNGKVSYARVVFDMMLEKDVICSTSLISGYMNQGSVEEAECIFHKTVEKDIVVFNAMIEGYSKSSEYAMRSIEVYIDMQRLNFRPNISTFASMIGACSTLTAPEIGQQVQSQLMKTQLYFNIKIGSALIDMYSKCGRVDEARRVFDHMPERNVFSWTSMIDGYGKNCFANEALDLFWRMQKEHSIEPNFVTFLSVLSACAHAGLVDKGWEIFYSMENEYS